VVIVFVFLLFCANSRNLWDVGLVCERDQKVGIINHWISDRRTIQSHAKFTEISSRKFVA
jgi:hypothetical protein